MLFLCSCEVCGRCLIKSFFFFLCLLRILQVAVYSRESQAPFQSGVQQCSLYPSGKHTVGAHPQTSALYLLLLHNRRKVQQEGEMTIRTGLYMDSGRCLLLAVLFHDFTSDLGVIF